MPEFKATSVEAAVLFTLMAEARELSNVELKGRGLELKAPNRKKLNERKLIESRQENRRFHHVLTDDGWAWCNDQLGAAPPPIARPLGVALYAVLAGLGRHFARENLRLSDVFLPYTEEASERDAPAQQAPPSAVPTVEQRIRDAYGALAPAPKDWVSLTDLRAKLADLPRAEVDAALRRMVRASDVSIVPESNQKTLTAADRTAAVTIGDQAKHLLAIGA